MATTRYASLADLKLRVDDTGTFTEADDIVYTQALEATSRAIDSFCRRSFGKTASVARTFTPVSALRLVVPDLVSVSSLKTDDDGDGTYETTWSSGDYILMPANATTTEPSWPYTRIDVDLRSGSAIETFPTSIQQGVQITGVWGWPEVPADVESVCILEALRLVQQEESPSAVVASAELGRFVVEPDLHPTSKRILSQYRRIASVR